MPAYPVAYRRPAYNQNPAPGGFQGPGDLPRPANDNKPGGGGWALPKPANDNKVPAPSKTDALKQVIRFANAPGRALWLFNRFSETDPFREIMDYGTGGATVIGTCDWSLSGGNSPPIGIARWTPGTGCLQLQALDPRPLGSDVRPPFTNPFIGYAIVGRDTAGPFWPRYQSIIRYQPQPAPMNGFSPVGGYVPLAPNGKPHLKPEIPPALDPWQQPINVPAMDPNEQTTPWKDLPYRETPRRASPTERPLKGPRVDPRKNPWRVGKPDIRPGAIPMNRNSPRYDPAGVTIELTVSPNGQTSVGSTPGFMREPPGRGVREGKLRRGAIAGAAALKAFGGFGEFGDAVAAIYDALPDKIKKADRAKVRKYDSKRPWFDKNGNVKTKSTNPSTAAKFASIYKNFPQLDHNKAFDNLMKNEIQDRAFGAIGKALGRAGGKAGQLFGFGTGPAL